MEKEYVLKHMQALENIKKKNSKSNLGQEKP